MPGLMCMRVAGLVGCMVAVVAAAPEPVQLTAPFVGGEGGYAIYRIPSLVVSKRGTLLALAEGRKGKGDQSENDIVLRRSGDGGRSWGALQVVADDGRNSLNNPTAVVLRESGRIILIYQRYPAALRERTVKEGVAGEETCLCFMKSSDDDGESWSAAVDITPQVKRPRGATSLASGPGVGSELERGEHRGRIVIPFNQGPYGKWDVYAAYSDNGGKSWKYGEVAPVGKAGRGNEVQVVELSDGRLLMNSRSGSGALVRKRAISGDGGESWSELEDDPALVESRCQGSLIRHSEPKGDDPGILLFSNPAVTKGRTHGTVRMSVDDGKTWTNSKLLVPGSFAYSCLAVLPDRSIVCLYETDEYGKIGLMRFTIDWLHE